MSYQSVAAVKNRLRNNDSIAKKKPFVSAPGFRVRSKSGVLVKSREMSSRSVVEYSSRLKRRSIWQRRDGANVFGGAEREEFGVVPSPGDPFRGAGSRVLVICTVLVAVQRGAAPVLGAGMGHCKGPGPMGFGGGSGCGTQYSVCTVILCRNASYEHLSEDGFASIRYYSSILHYQIQYMLLTPCIDGCGHSCRCRYQCSASSMHQAHPTAKKASASPNRPQSFALPRVSANYPRQQKRQVGISPPSELLLPLLCGAPSKNKVAQ